MKGILWFVSKTVNIGNGINSRTIGLSCGDWALKLRGLVSVAKPLGAIAAASKPSVVFSVAGELPERFLEVLARISIALRGLGLR